jgi:hypothetical protein
MGTAVVAKKDNTFYMVDYNTGSGDEWTKTLGPMYQKVVESVVIK